VVKGSDKWSHENREGCKVAQGKIVEQASMETAGFNQWVANTPTRYDGLAGDKKGAKGIDTTGG
jgi:hypothetical protein